MGKLEIYPSKESRPESCALFPLTSNCLLRSSRKIPRKTEDMFGMVKGSEEKEEA